MAGSREWSTTEQREACLAPFPCATGINPTQEGHLNGLEI